MAYLDYRNRVKRIDFSKIDKVIEIPNLIQAQQESYNEFLQINIPVERRRASGLPAVFKGIFPIADYNGRASLEFVSYVIPRGFFSTVTELSAVWSSSGFFCT